MVTMASSNVLSENLLRYSTYSNFPGSCPVFASRLSSAGFSYGGKGDIVTCSACGLKEGNWNGIEAPLLVHARKSPSCPLILSLRKPDSYDVMKSGSKCSEDVEEFEAPTSDKCDRSANPGNILLKLEPKPSTKDLSTKNEETNHQHNTESMSAFSSGYGSYDRIDGLYSNSSTESGNFVHMSPSPNSLPSSSSMIPYTNPRYPNNTIMSERLKTFNNWPSHYPQSPENLAKAGFFYTGINDLVRCYHCGGGLTSWEAEDNAWVEHAHWFPQCTYLRQNKGDEFIQLVQSMVGELTEESNHQQENTGDALGVGATCSNYNTHETETDIEGLISVRSVKEMGYTMEIIRPAYKEAVHQHKTTAISAVQLMEKVLEIEERSSNTTHAQPIEGASANMSATEKTNQSIQNSETSSDVPKPVPSSADNQIPCVQYETTTGECKGSTSGDVNNKDLLLCKVCLEEDVSIVFLPCGHLATCGQCAPAMKRCPICRTHVRGSVKTYLS
ncbi:putative inhibitor of apoptosis isoform X1 [Mytilus galloprovincialis]|uniref:putative inhibitor of apoptosis isoform X1 n=1 Tax=Mytilus galloprovincialis TaxID=29158 RepID=UPI003F7C96AD